MYGVSGGKWCVAFASPSWGSTVLVRIHTLLTTRRPDRVTAITVVPQFMFDSPTCTRRDRFGKLLRANARISIVILMGSWNIEEHILSVMV